MKKNALMILVLGFLALILIAEPGTYLKVKVRMAPIRSKPKKNSQLLGRLKYGTILELLSRHGKWYHIKEKSGTLKGYVHDNFVTGGELSAPGTGNKQTVTRKKRRRKGSRPERPLQEKTQLIPDNLRDELQALPMKIINWNEYTFYLITKAPNSEKLGEKTIDMLKGLINEFPVSPWVRVRDIIIRKDAISQSNPFTINTRYNKDRYMLLATFLHEQIHRLEPENMQAFTQARLEIQSEFPDLDPSVSDEPVRAYRHFIVCYFEIEALKKLLGLKEGLAVINKKDKNVWIYQQILIPTNAATIRSICQKYRLNPEYR